MSSPGGGKGRLDSTHYDVVIIGAGLSGLVCADETLSAKPDCKVLVLEGADRVGGRTKTIDVELGDGRTYKADAGGMWLGPTHGNMLQLCQRFGIETIQQYYVEGKHVLTRGTASTTAAYKGEIPPYSYASLIELQLLVLNKVEGLAKSISLEDFQKHPKAAEWDAESVRSYFNRVLWTETSKDVVELVCWSLLGLQASQVSLLYFLYFLRANEGLKMLTDATGGAQDRRMVGGAQQVSERLATAVREKGGEVVFSSKVVGVSCVSSDLTVVECHDGRQYKARNVVSAGCVSKFLQYCRFSPPLPRTIGRFTDATMRGSYAKAIVTYKTAWWREAGFSGFATCTRPTTDSCVAFAYDYGPTPALTCFITADVGERVSDLDEHQRRLSVLNSLALFFPSHAKTVREQVVSYHDEFWQKNEFAGGGPMTVYPPGTFMHYSAQKLFRKPYALRSDPSQRPILYFAGTDVSTSWIGYMEGACVRGKEVAHDLVAHLATKSEDKPHDAEDDDRDEGWSQCI